MRNSNTSKNMIRLFLFNLLIIGMVIAGFYFMRGTNQIVTVQTTAINLHQKPSPNSTVITQVHKEDKVTIKEKKEDWYKIQTSDKVEGWVASWLIFDGKSSPYTYLPAVITQRKTELKENHNESSKTLTTLKKREKVFVTLELNGWSRIYAEDTYGWVPSDSLEIRKSQQPNFDVGDSLQVTLDNTHLYSSMSETSDVKETLAYADKVTVTESDHDFWYQVTTKDGKKGYVRSWEVTTNALSKKDKRPSEPKSEYTVMLDPGHGGEDPGAETNDGKVKEKDLTLKTAQAVKKELENNGYNVLMTRSGDDFVTLSRIAKKSNESKADAFVSFHYDSSGNPNEGSGTTSFYRHDSGRPLAQAVNDQIADILPLENRGFAMQDYQVLRENERPAILLELGYINNDLDASYAQSPKYHQKVAEAVTNGLNTYIDGLKEK
ncbi:N-acetylmuramoyl-L-alanine amidase [Vagococcus sp. DIV0080]|uniref:N-acetylmuramoyl-L-alanine amidase n=1 Tax=Candidatus Vagococcus giribetii TaxID=2230876 RepID=A0ABS3HT29_9ENTE|nr:N-acetylmuramoyl-L-alanine amidase [Vagococcus sp. DIV0080]